MTPPAARTRATAVLESLARTVTVTVTVALAGAAMAVGLPASPALSAPLPAVSKVTTTTLEASSLQSVVRSTTGGIAAVYVNGVLTVTWGVGNVLTVPGPLRSGDTVDRLTASILGPPSLQCDGPASLATVTVDQWGLSATGAVQTLSLQFGCVAAVSGDHVFGTVGIDVPPSVRAGGYNLVESDGVVTGFGVGQFLGALGDEAPVATDTPVAGVATTPLDGGYWTAGSEGGVFTYGDAPFFGSAGAVHLNRPIVGMAATPDGRGYWLVASDGGIFTYGDARFFGSTGAVHLNRPIVGMAATPDGRGYWLVASDGGIFCFGDAAFHGSTGAVRLDSPIVGMATTADGDGYWIASADGGVFSFGDATFSGSLGGSGVDDVVGIAR